MNSMHVQVLLVDLYTQMYIQREFITTENRFRHLKNTSEQIQIDSIFCFISYFILKGGGGGSIFANEITEITFISSLLSAGQGISSCACIQMNKAFPWFVIFFRMIWRKNYKRKNVVLIKLSIFILCLTDQNLRLYRIWVLKTFKAVRCHCLNDIYLHKVIHHNNQD